MKDIHFLCLIVIIMIFIGIIYGPTFKKKFSQPIYESKYDVEE